MTKTSKYFSLDVDPSLGVGRAYMEFTGEQVTRQIEVYDGRWYYSDDPEEYFPDLGPALSDQSLSSLLKDKVIDSSKEMTQEEFEKMWSDAQHHRKA